MQSERVNQQEASSPCCTCGGIKSGMQIKDALRVQLDIQRRLHEQLEIQRNLQRRIEAQGNKLQKMFEEQLKASRSVVEPREGLQGVSEQEDEFDDESGFSKERKMLEMPPRAGACVVLYFPFDDVQLLSAASSSFNDAGSPSKLSS